MAERSYTVESPAERFEGDVYDLFLIADALRAASIRASIALNSDSLPWSFRRRPCTPPHVGAPRHARHTDA
jgi:hypothetical protein